jgi:hypothetical protein
MTERPGQDGETAPHPIEAVFTKLRAMALHLDPAEIGLPREPSSTPVWGAVMDTTYAGGTATLVCLRDGTTSLYTSTGGGTIGGGGHEQIAEAAAIFLTALEAQLDDLVETEDERLPPEGWVFLRALTYDGMRAVSALEDDLGYQRSPLSPVFFAAQDVLTQLRLLDERRSD